MGSAGDTLNNGWASEPIAIIGMSAKFAGDAVNTDQLWDMLVEGRSGWSPFPESRFHADGIFNPNNERLNTVRLFQILKASAEVMLIWSCLDARSRCTFSAGRCRIV